MRTILTHCNVIDCTGKPPLKDVSVVIEYDKIAELKPGVYRAVAGEEEGRVFDLEGGYVLPGLWDVHNHLGDLIPDTRHLLSSEPAVDYAIRAGRNAIDGLRAGVTSLRIVGDRDFVDVSWKRAFDAGVFMGPRLFVSGHMICATGGHGWEDPINLEVDGPYAVRKVVREQLKQRGGLDQASRHRWHPDRW